MTQLAQAWAARGPATFDSLPPAVQLSIFLLLPRLVDRIRCALVSKKWTLRFQEVDPAFWAHVSFEGAARPELLDDAAALAVCRRSAGQLLSLDVSDDAACGRIIFRLNDGRTLSRALAAEGITPRLHTLVTPGFVTTTSSSPSARRGSVSAPLRARVRCCGTAPRSPRPASRWGAATG